MGVARDWPKTLWPASYMGVPFYFDKDSSEGGRDAKIHEFPHRDIPFIEDLGAKARHYEGDAYVHGDDADARSATFEETLNSQGPGILVVPIYGPVLVHCLYAKRTSQKDKLGYIAFNVKFVRDGAASALISVPLAGRLVAVAADAIASALAGIFPVATSTIGQPDFVVDAAVSGVQTIGGTIEASRQAWPVDPATAAKLRDGVADLVAAAPLLLTNQPATASDVSTFAGQVSAFVSKPASDGPTLIAQAVIGLVRSLGSAMPPDSAAPAMLDFASAFDEAIRQPPTTPAAAVAAANTVSVNQLARLSALTAWSEALALRSFPDRPAGVTARAEAAARFEAELNTASGAVNVPVYVAIEQLRARVVDYLSRLINDLAPVISIDAPRSMPGLYWAYRLYSDPTRVAELVARNSVRHPSFMPTDFEALAAGYPVPASLPTSWPAP